ncbi:hypothetical protein J6590_107590, partial [Homalodisca vitripennis]
NVLVMNLAISDFFLLAKMPIFIFNCFYFGPALGALEPSLKLNLETNGFGEFRTTTNGRASELLARTGSLNSHPSKQHICARTKGELGRNRAACCNCYRQWRLRELGDFATLHAAHEVALVVVS